MIRLCNRDLRKAPDNVGSLEAAPRLGDAPRVARGEEFEEADEVEDAEDADKVGPEAQRRRTGALGPLLALSAVPVLVMALSAVTGLGLARNLPTLPAVAGAAAIVLLPVFGLASLIGTGSRPGELGGSAWFWSLAVLLAMPFYFPGERAEAARTGLDYLTSPVPDDSRTGVLRFGSALVALLGSEPEHTPLASPLPGADAARASETARRVAAAREATGDVVIPYNGDGESLRIAAFFDGPRYGEELPMIFDTGATYTTLSRKALELLEVEVPADAPIAVLRTANGEVEAQLVLVDAVWLGDAVVEWVTVAVCDSCASDEVYGLLGLNVTGRFQVAIDHDHQQIQLGALEGEENRKLDVGQWLGLRSRLLHWQDGRLEVEVTGENRAGVPIAQVSTEIECPGGRFEVLLDAVPPRKTTTRKVALPRGTDCSEYALTLRRAIWSSDRFGRP